MLICGPWIVETVDYLGDSGCWLGDIESKAKTGFKLNVMRIIRGMWNKLQNEKVERRINEIKRSKR
jgi:hypothetical protein